MSKNILQRIEKLEAAEKTKTEKFDNIVILCPENPPAMKRALTDSERIVDDWHVEPDGSLGLLQLRVTTDPSDCGRNYLRDEMGNEEEDTRLEREISKCGRILSVVTKAGTKPLWKGRIGTRVIKYIS